MHRPLHESETMTQRSATPPDPARVPLTQLARTTSARPALARIVQAAAPGRVQIAAFNSSV